LACWLLAALTAAGVAVEFCIVYFGTELLTAAGLRTAAAATAMSSLYVGILAGRAGAAWLTRRTGRAVALLWVSLAVSAAGFLVFWLGDRPAVMIAGLFWCGLGIANLYPLSLAVTLAAAPGRGDTAQARTQLLVGCAGIAAPYLLGNLADRLGLHAAFTIEPALIAVSAGLLVAGLRLARRTEPKGAASPPG
jgi:fucose permease